MYVTTVWNKRLFYREFVALIHRSNTERRFMPQWLFCMWSCWMILMMKCSWWKLTEVCLFANEIILQQLLVVVLVNISVLLVNALNNKWGVMVDKIVGTLQMRLVAVSQISSVFPILARWPLRNVRNVRNVNSDEKQLAVWCILTVLTSH